MMPTMTRPGGYLRPEPKRCIRCGRKLGAQGLIRFCLNPEACRRREVARAAKPALTGKGFTHDWQGTPYASTKCGQCGVTLRGPVSRMPVLEHQHAQRCDKATPAEREHRLITGRWPAEKK